MSSLIDAFERGEIDPAAFRHGEHVQMAWAFLRELPFAEAALRFTRALQRFAAANGNPGIYHETITWAYLVLLNERMALSREESWESFQEQNPDLFVWKPSILDALYQPGTLGSELARRVFILPDRR